MFMAPRHSMKHAALSTAPRDHVRIEQSRGATTLGRVLRPAITDHRRSSYTLSVTSVLVALQAALALHTAWTAWGHGAHRDSVFLALIGVVALAIAVEVTHRPSLGRVGALGLEFIIVAGAILRHSFRHPERAVVGPGLAVVVAVLLVISFRRN